MVMMALRDAEAGPQPTTMASHREPQRQMHGRPILVKLACNRDAQDRYVDLISFEMEVTNILETKAHKLTEEEMFSVTKY